MRLPRLLLCLVCCAILVPAGAQTRYASALLNQPLRIEYNASSDNETYRVVPCGSLGIVLFYKSVEKDENGKPKWYFTYYDHNLQVNWTKSVPLEEEIDFSLSDLGGDTLSLFFQASPKTKDPSVIFRILRIALPNGNLILNNGDMPAGASANQFRVVHQTAFATMQIHNAEAQLMVVNLPTGDIAFYPVTGASQTGFVTLVIDPQSLALTGIVRKQVSKKYWDNYLITGGPHGLLPGETLITTISAERELVDCRLAEPSGHGTLVLGTYLMASSATDQQQAMTRSSGFFGSQFDGTNQKTLFFNNYLDLKCAGSLLSEKDLLAIRKKAMKKTRSSEEFSSDLNVVLHDAFRFKGQNILVGESYYAQYHTETFTDFDFYGRPFTNTYNVFDGYRFSNAIVAAFDDNGQLLWDNSMEIRNLLTDEQIPHVSVFPSGNNLVMAYLSEGKVASQIIHEGSVVEKTEYSELDLADPNDRLVTETKSMLVPWYGNYFLCYGYQEIKNISGGGKAKKLVFYCNKVQFE